MNETQQLQDAQSLLLRVVGSSPTSLSEVTMRPEEVLEVCSSALLLSNLTQWKYPIQN